MRRHHKDQPLEPFPSTVEIGYKLTKARLHFTEPKSYLTQAINEMLPMRKDVVNDARDRGIRANEHDFSEVMVILWNAVHAQIQYHANPSHTDYGRVNAAAESIGHAHKLLADIMRDYGYRDITLEDFAEFGSGGTR
jgi:hypothetical protein